MDVMWLWGALGLALLAAEMASGTIYLLWFGISALCMAILVWIYPDIHYGIQFALFAVLSATALAIWKLNYKKTETHSRVGQSQGEEIGRVGIIIQPCGPTQNGLIQFTQGVMGSREWIAVSSESLNIGQQAQVTAVEGNTLRVAAHTSS
jgi:membrane protein implicated in regulation of membrane protease activity